MLQDLKKKSNFTGLIIEKKKPLKWFSPSGILQQLHLKKNN